MIDKSNTQQRYVNTPDGKGWTELFSYKDDHLDMIQVRFANKKQDELKWYKVEQIEEVEE